MPVLKRAKSSARNKEDVVMRFYCGCSIVNRADTGYREFFRIVCPHHQFHDVEDAELSQRQLNFDVLANILNRGIFVSSEEMH